MQGGPLDATLAVDDSSDEIPAIGACVASRYVIEEVIGSGGMSIVVRARDLRLDCPVALKMLRRSRGVRGAQLARFVREARTVARLQSDHVVRILDVDAASDPPYLAMDLVLDGDVAQLLEKKGPLPVHRALDIVLQACRGVADAHAIDIVHRDLKPSNLLLARAAHGAMRVKVADFGISKAMDQQSGPDLTASGQILGSPRYMSPEQVRSGAKVDARSDVWALGAILYELISGRAPFEAETIADTLARIVNDPAPPLEGVEIPPRLSAVVAMCLQKEAALRPPSVTALIQELEAIELRSPGAESPGSTRESGVVGLWSRSVVTGHPPRRRLGASLAAAAALAAFVAGMGVGGTRARKSDVERPVPASAGSAPSTAELSRLGQPELLVAAVPALTEAAPKGEAATTVPATAPSLPAPTSSAVERRRARGHAVQREAGADELELDRR